nr:DUF2235 domain-containing protein [Segatella oris]
MGKYSNSICGNESNDSDSSSEITDITIIAGIFFDGTNNNKYNVDFWENGPNIHPSDKEGYELYRKLKDDTDAGHYASYKDSIKTNIAELWYMYDTAKMPNCIKVYVEGPGTESPIESKSVKPYSDEDGMVSSGEDDISRGYIVGSGDTGVNAKIERGCQLLVDKVLKKIRSIRRKQLKLNLILDVFGFSRGATAARSFVHRLLKRFIYQSVTEDKKVTLEEQFDRIYALGTISHITTGVRFLGLFDTVSSYNKQSMISPSTITLLWSTSPFENDVEELQLTIPPYVGSVVQLVAADEYRECFGLTNIASAETARGEEIILPGAHSDIGGGYKRYEEEYIYMSDGVFRDVNEHETGKRQCRGYLSLQELMDGRWLPFDWLAPQKSLDRYGKSVITYNKKRLVYNTYAKIPLYIMGRKAASTKVTWIYPTSANKVASKGILWKNRVFEVTTSLDSESLIDLKKLRDVLEEKHVYGYVDGKISFIGDSDDWEKILAVRTNYLHLSARAETGHHATSDNERIIYNG